MAISRLGRKRMVPAKMTINHARPWYINLAVVILVLGLGGGLAAWTYDQGRSFALNLRFDPKKLEQLQEQVKQLTAERDQLQIAANTNESQQNIEKSVQKQLTEQVKSLTAENQKLKDDLAFFETIVPAGKTVEGVAVQGMKAELVAPNQLHYRVLVMQGGKNNNDFNGELQMTLTLVQTGKPVMMQFPDPKQGEVAKLKLSFKHYQRLEGVIAIPDGATVKAMQAKVLERGLQRAQQSISL